MVSLLDDVNRVRDGLALPRLTSLVDATPAARRTLALVNDAGEEIRDHHAFQALRTIETLDTADGQAAYDLPADLAAIVDDTIWDRTLQRKLRHETAARWAQLLAGDSIGAAESRFRIVARQLVIFPTPSSVRALAFEYRSSAWVDEHGAGASFADLVANDDDATRFDQRLMRLSLRWRLRRQNGYEYAQEEQDYRDALELAVARDEPTGSLFQTGAGGGFRLLDGDNIPDSGFGA